MAVTAPRRTEAVVARGPAARRSQQVPDTRAAQNVVNEASKNAQQVASTATHQGQQVGQGAIRQARQVVDTSRQQGAQVAQELSDQARGLLDETRTQLQDQAQIQAQRVSEALRRLGGEAQALAEGRPQDARTLGDYLAKTAVKLDEIADDLDSKGAQGLLEDLETLARSHPGSFLLGAGVVGLAVGRLLRNAKDDRQPAPEELAQP